MKNPNYSLLLIALLFASIHCPAQIINTVIGRGPAEYMTEGSPATAGKISHPSCVAVDVNGNIYYGDNGYARVRRVNRAGIISTFAGTGEFDYSGDGGPAVAAHIFNISALAIDASQNVYIVDAHSNVVRKVDAYGVISTFAGNGTSGYCGDGGPATAAQLNQPSSIAIDDAGNVYVADVFNQVIRKIDAAGIITTFAGNTISGFSGDGGPATAAQLRSPISVAADHSGNVYIADGLNAVIRKVNAAGIISSIAGILGATGYTGDGGPATAATISQTVEITTDPLGNLFLADVYNNVVRKVNSAGIITTIAGNGFAAGESTPGGIFMGDGGSPVFAGLNWPRCVAFDAVGNMYIPDSYDNAVRKVSAISGTIHVCTGDATTLNTPVAGGVWVSSMPGVATVGSSSGVVTGVATGNAVIYYAIGTDTAAARVIVNTVPIAGTITGNDSVCAGSSIVLANTTPGGVWVLSNSKASNIGSKVMGHYGGIDTMLYNIEYTCGIASAQHPVTIAQPDAGALYGPNHVCQGDTIAVACTVPGGTWSVCGTSLAYVVSPGVVMPLSLGTVVVAYTVHTTIPGCSASVSYTVYIDSPSHCWPAAVVNTIMHDGESLIYPNPATNTVYIEMTAISEPRLIVINDVYGRVVLTKTVPGNTTKAELDLHIPQGTYMLSINSSNNRPAVHKLVIE